MSLHIKGDKRVIFVSCSILALAILAPLIMLLISFLSSTSNSNTPVFREFVGIRQQVLLGRSVLLAVFAGSLGTLMGLIFGYAVSMQPIGKQRVFALCMALPLLIPPFIHALSWIVFCDWFGIACHGFLPTMLILSASFFPVAGLLSWVGFSQSRGAMTEAALLGHSRLRVFSTIELGLVRPHLWTSFMLIALFSFSDYGVPSLLRVNTYPVVVFSQFAAFYDLRSAVFSSWPYLILPVAALAVWQSMVSPRLFETLVRGQKPNVIMGIRNEAKLWGAIFMGLLLPAAVLPMVVLFVTAGGASTYAAAWLTAHTQILMSLFLSIMTATFIMIIGSLVSVGIHRSSGIVCAAQDYASLLPIALPGTLFGIGMILLWNRPATRIIYGTASIIVLLYAARFLPFAIRTQLVGLKQIGRNLLEAAKLSDRPSRTIFTKIHVPLMVPSAAMGFILCFILSFRELAGTLLVTPPGTETLAVRIYSLYHYGAGKLVAALSLFMLASSLIVLAGVLTIYRSLRKC